MRPKEARTGKDDGTRKTASVVSMIAGVPTLIVSLLTLLGGLIGFVFLAVMLVALILDDQGKGNEWAALFIIIFIIIIIAALIALVVIIAILLVLAFALSSQVIGGYFAFKGERFTLAVVLMGMGAVLTFILGGIMLMFAIIFAVNERTSVIWPLLLWGGYNILSAIVTGVCTGIVASKKDTFIKTEGKKKPKVLRT